MKSSVPVSAPSVIWLQAEDLLPKNYHLTIDLHQFIVSLLHLAPPFRQINQRFSSSSLHALCAVLWSPHFCSYALMQASIEASDQLLAAVLSASAEESAPEFERLYTECATRLAQAHTLGSHEWVLATGSAKKAIQEAKNRLAPLGLSLQTVIAAPNLMASGGGVRLALDLAAFPEQRAPISLPPSDPWQPQQIDAEPSPLNQMPHKPASPQLSGRETEIMDYLAQAWSTGQIAQAMHIRYDSVKRHLREIYRKKPT